MAVKNKTTLTNEKNAAIADNVAGDITPAIDRGVRQDDIDSALNIASGNLTQTVESEVNFTAGLQVNGVTISASNLPTIVSIDNTDSPYAASWGEDIEIDCSAGAVTIDLPAATGNGGETLYVTKIDNSLNQVTLNPDGSETINGDSSKLIKNQFTSLTLRAHSDNIGIR